MEENKPIQNEEEVKPPNNPQDAVHEQQLNNLSTDEPIVAAAETTSEIEQQPTTNNKPETEDMEVHHHTHASHGKKNWKSYFWEFLMLFLAVFCGFLAEYQLEHVIEHQREKKFAESLYEDLKKDTVDLRGDISGWESLLKNLDTVRTEIEKPVLKRDALLLYKKAALMRSYDNFEYHDRTIEQLKNGGNFRLIRKAAISDSLIDYDAAIKSRLRDQEMQSNVIYQAINFLQDKLFSSKFYGTNTVAHEAQLDSAFKVSPEIFIPFKEKEAELFEYYNHLQFYKFMTKYRLHTCKALLRKATNLIELIKKEYSLE